MRSSPSVRRRPGVRVPAGCPGTARRGVRRRRREAGGSGRWNHLGARTRARRRHGGVAYRLVTIDGLPVDSSGATIDLPDAELLGSDGRGGLVVRRAGDVFAVGVDGADRLTTGELVAIGADVAYVRKCADIDTCDITRVDRRSGARSTPDGGFGADSHPTARTARTPALGTSVSPDGDVLLVKLPGGRSATPARSRRGHSPTPPAVGSRSSTASTPASRWSGVPTPTSRPCSPTRTCSCSIERPASWCRCPRHDSGRSAPLPRHRPPRPPTEPSSAPGAAAYDQRSRALAACFALVSSTRCGCSL